MTPAARVPRKDNTTNAHFYGCSGCRAMIVTAGPQAEPTHASGWTNREGRWLCEECGKKAGARQAS